MSIALPKPIATYFTADKKRDPDHVSRCFLDTAFVKDEGNTYLGRDKIRQWMAESAAKYTYTATPFIIAREHDLTVVTSHLTGDFPGSPVDLRYFFVLQDDMIATLEIRI
jgi:uncharacterized circularly permuted ATP-grasp superfamily protein